MAQGNTLLTKLKDALKAIDEAPASIKSRDEIKELRRQLNRIIQGMGTTPGPSPNVDD